MYPIKHHPGRGNHETTIDSGIEYICIYIYIYICIYMYRYTKNQHEITPENQNLEKHHLPKPISNRVMIFRGLPSPDPAPEDGWISPTVIVRSLVSPVFLRKTIGINWFFLRKTYGNYNYFVINVIDQLLRADLPSNQNKTKPVIWGIQVRDITAISGVTLSPTKDEKQTSYKNDDEWVKNGLRMG